MSDQIKFLKGSNEANLPSSLATGSVYFCEDTCNLYIGDSNKKAKRFASAVGNTVLNGSNIGEIFNDYTNNSAKGNYSHAEGQGTIATGNYQHVQGKYNIEDTNNSYAHIIGNGNSSTRANIHTVDWNGNAWFAGNVSVDGSFKGPLDGTAKNATNDGNGNNIVNTYGTKTEVNAKLPLAGGTMTATATIKWPEKNSRNPYIGYCAHSSDGTFILGSLDGNKWDTGLCIGGSSGNLLWKGKKVIDISNIMVAASSSKAGEVGLVPAPAVGKQSSYLRGDGTWATPTNTKNTTGSTDSSSKLFLIGATTQAANPQTYSHDTAYVGTDGYLYSNSEKIWPRIYGTIVPYGTSIPANADLNTIDYLKVGNYYCGSNATVKTLKNCPLTTYDSSGAGTAGSAFMMQVYSPLSETFDNETTGTWVYRIRKIMHYGTGIEYVQQCYVGGTAGASNWIYGDWYVTPLGKFTLNKTSASTAAIGSSTKPVYINASGMITACTYTLGKSVPSDAVFTDTTYTFDGAVSTIKDSNLTASRALISNSSGKVAVSAVTSTELGYLDGVTSAIQTQLNGKQATITGAATTVTSSDLTASRALVSNSSGKIAVSSITSTKLGYLTDVTSNIQAQLNGKAPSSHNHSGDSLNPASIELKGSSSHGGYIDFHYNQSTSDYTTRIIEDASGKLSITASSGVYIGGSKVVTASNFSLSGTTLTITI